MIKVSKEVLNKKLKEAEEKQKESLEKMNKEKFPVGLTKLVITKVEKSKFNTKNGEVNKIKIFLNTALKKSKEKYYDFNQDFPFFVFKDKETGEDKCIAFEQLYTFIYNAFGKAIQFKSEEVSIDSAVEDFAKALNYFKEKETPFYSIVIHQETVYKDKLMYFPGLYLSSVRSMTNDIKEIEELDKKMKNKVWKIRESEKKKLLAKKRNQSNSFAEGPEDGVPEGVENYSADLTNMENEDKDDDLPF